MRTTPSHQWLLRFDVACIQLSGSSRSAAEHSLCPTFARGVRDGNGRRVDCSRHAGGRRED
eukprot:9102840-Alexandrium_andersonii.AAC.1